MRSAISALAGFALAGSFAFAQPSDGATNSLKRKKSSAIIAADVRRFSHLINTDEVFGTHTGLRFTQPALLCAYQ
jgi:hypothetical protein